MREPVVAVFVSHLENSFYDTWRRRVQSILKWNRLRWPKGKKGNKKRNQVQLAKRYRRPSFTKRTTARACVQMFYLI
tara:strand:- start:622 stop:852 length:231 start_codon:yes stop_codon:yes gene_type:complete